MSQFLKLTLRVLFFLLLQFVLCDMVPLWGFITPYIYFICLFWFPFKINPRLLMLIATCYGFILDYYVLTPGIHASACLTLAYIRPHILNLLLPKEINQMNYAEPSIYSLGISTYFVYATMLILIHNFILIFLQWISVGNLGYFLLKLFLTSIVSILLVAIVEIILQRKQKTRTSLK